ncbi:transcription initiation factor TFIID subunit 5 [Phanerochaete sordida]|uniref:Transcription initiation factor TFIID subunit 5 n=1 Tax=Phanerochaete sordida TaxID=48140 RepID=A0A9P3G3Q0_9APHY|nr:transcription initiation factor TFIID subunit 5 [Phanerochaete sordida]
MSTPTPAASTPDGQSPAATNPPDPSTANLNATDKLVLEYLRSRGHAAAEKQLRESLEASSPGEKTPAPPAASTISPEELASRIAVYAQKSARPGENALKDSGAVVQELGSLSTQQDIQKLISSIGPVGAEDILSLDPTDKQEGFRELEAWVDGSLDMYKPEFRPILFPIFVHFYLDLIQQGFKEAALRFHEEFSPSLRAQHNQVIHHLSTLLLPSHVQHDELAQRFRNQKYEIRMSRSGFSLLVGWLTEGVGGEATGSGDGFTGERGKRGRAAVMRVVNNHLKFDVTTSNTASMSPNAWEETTGVLSPLLPQAGFKDAASFNASKGELKLGPAPLPEELQQEAERELREKAMLERDPSGQLDAQHLRPSVPGLVSPSLSDLPPHPSTFKMTDVKREVERVRDARKRIKLEPAYLNGVNPNSPQAAAARARALPSICAYTLHDVGEGVPCITFSQDTSLMAAGFSESYIRLWSLKGEKLKGYRSDFQSSQVKDPATLRKQREKGGSTTRKLIGHGGPVYSVDFDPISGSAGPPRYLISSSADATARLWSLDTMTNVVAYRGHQNPVWDVQWSPMGIYFATASRDKTARLWSTDRTSALRIYAGHLSDVDCVRFHPNSLYLATGSSDWTARLWDVQKGSCVRVFIGHQGIVSTLAFSPDGRYLATAGEDLAINLWDIGSGKRIKKMTGHTASIYSLSFSAESSLLVSGGADWTVRCWDVKSAGGQPSKARENGINGLTNGVNGTSDHGADALPNGAGKDHEENIQTTDLLATFPTKRTPIIDVQFTPRNLCLVAGPYLAPEQR